MPCRVYRQLFLGFGLVACTSPEEDSGEMVSPTWTKDVQPIVARSCQGCHSRGSVGGFALSTYEEVVAFSDLVAREVEAETMPPWAPADDCNEYKDNLSLSGREKSIILDWVAGDMALGEPPFLEVEPIQLDSELSRVDFTLKPDAAFVPEGQPDDYRCFLVDWPLDEEMYVTGYKVRPDKEPIVHHVIAYLLDEKYKGELMALAGRDDQAGYTCFGGPGLVAQENAAWLGGWAPGGADTDLPEGTGIRVKPDTVVVMQVHYNTEAGTALADRTSIDIMVEPEVDVEAWVQPFTNPFWLYGDQMEIPAGSEDYTVNFGYEFENGATVYTANPHMHKLGQSVRFSVEHPDGSETCLLDVPAYDFNWQRTYSFLEPQTFYGGDVMKIECIFDNPGEENVYWGDQTADEMCLVTTLMID